MGAWKREDPNTKAEVIAHYMEKNTRESYNYDQAKKNHEDPNRPQPVEPPNWGNYRQGGGK